jgi:predicted Zn-dependent peptidase
MFKKKIFKNGLTLITAPMKNTRSVTVLILVGAGSKYETKEKNGISHFLEHMCFKGTKKRPTALDISKEIDSVGGIMNAFTGKDYTGYFIKIDSSHFELALDVAFDVFLNSTFPREEIEKERGVILEEIKLYQDTPTHYIDTLWEKLLYNDQPAGWDIAGSKETILNIKRDDFLKYIKNFYLPQNTVISVAGVVNEKVLLDKIKEYFGSVKRRKQKSKPKVKESQKKPEKLFYKKDTSQVHLALGVRAFNLFDKRKYPLQILSVILGGNMSSRLFQEIREKRGLAYYVRTQIELNPDTGYLVSYAGVDYDNLKETIDLIIKEYKKIKEKGVTKEEFLMAKEYIKGVFRLSLEDSENIANFYGAQYLLEKKVLTPEEKIKEIEKVKIDDIQKVAKEIFKNEKLNLAFIGRKDLKMKNFRI